MEQVYDNGYRMYKVSNPEMPEKTFIICSEPGAKILYQPHIAGKELQDSMESVATIFMDAVSREVLKGKKQSSITELIFLAGGLYYQLNHGFKKVHNIALPQCFLGIKRQKIEGSKGKFTAVATYENFESLPDNGTVIIGDTIATGATLRKGTRYLLEAINERNYKIENLVICSFACSVNGGRVLKELEKRITSEFPNAKVWMFVSEQFFHLMPDGTDLRFLYPDAVMPEETRKRTLETYGELLGKEMKCAVFDWGTRCKNPIRHYHEILEFMLDIKHNENALDATGKQVIERMERETMQKLAEFEKRLE